MSPPRDFRGTTKDRLLAKIHPEPNTGCWLWAGARNDVGYGQIMANGRPDYVHRVAYELFTGPIPPDYRIDHLCRVTLCCNPDHLEAVTHGENIRRGFALKPRKTHCVNGHEYTDDNAIVRKDGKTICRACKTKRDLAWVRTRRAVIALTIAGSLTGCFETVKVVADSYCPIKATELIDLRDPGLQRLTPVNQGAVLTGDDNHARFCRGAVNKGR